MRNDAHDELDHVPSLTAGRDREKPYPAPELEPFHKPEASRSDGKSRQKRRGGSTAPLWVLVIALCLALGGFAWWSDQQMSRLEMQLVATQESFARISEDAAGRLQDISGKVVASESSVTTESEAIKLRIKQLEKQAIDLTEQQRAVATQMQSLTGKQGNQDQRLERLVADLQGQQSATGSLDEGLKALKGEQAALKSSVDGLGDSQEAVTKLTGRLDGLSKDVAALKQKGDNSQAVSRLEQDLLVLRSELDNRPAPQVASANTAEFDAFRAQMSRNIRTLQSQIANLQEQLDAAR